MKVSDIIEKYYKKICGDREEIKFNKIFSKRCYMLYLLSDNREFLKKAYFQTVKDFRANPSDLELMLFCAFLCVETGNMIATEMYLKKIGAYKNYIRSFLPKMYSAFLYVYIIFFIKNGDIINIEKYERMLEEHFKTVKCKYAEIFLAAVEAELDNFNLAKKYLDNACARKENSFFLFLVLVKYFKSKNKSIYCTEKLFIPFIRWAFFHGFDISGIVELYSSKMVDYFNSDRDFFIKMYKKFPNEKMLIEICKRLIVENDYSAEAFEFYKQAVSKQMYLTKLNTFFVKSAFKNNIETVAIYPLKLFLQSGEADDEIKPYLYHQLLTNKKFKDILSKYYYDVLDFGKKSLENGKRGIYLNSVFKFITEQEDCEFVRYVEKAKNILKDEVFLYDIMIDNANAQYCYISEKEKKGVTKYKILDGKCLIKAVSDNFSVYAADEKCKYFYNSGIKIVKHVENSDFKLYKNLYLSGVCSDEIIIALAYFYIGTDYPKEDSLDFKENIIKKLVKLSVVSDEFKMKAFLVLGNLKFSVSDFDAAAYCYERVDGRFIKDKFIENVFLAFLHIGKIQNVVDIMCEKSYCISDVNLQKGIKKAFEYEKFRPIIANIAYELIMKSKYDRYLINLVSNYYNGGIKDWQNLSEALFKMGFPDERIDEKVLRTAFWTRSFDEISQRIFAVMYENQKENSVLNGFIEYCCYEIIVNGSKPAYRTIAILEEMFYKTNEEMFAYALSHIYIKFQIETGLSKLILEESLDRMKAAGLLFPVFKEAVHMFKDDEYIQKNYPFVYFASPNKNIVLYYREAEERNFRFSTMKYFNFGMYILALPVFYSENIEYYICEQMDGGSVETKKQWLFNDNKVIFENSDDLFFQINNAIVYEKMFKYDKVESIIDSKVKDAKRIKGKLL